MNEKTKNDNWDKPARVDEFEREPFVATIVETIKSADEGFNFGISAKWGEGKSSILEQLRPKLEKLNYKVLKFEPWKYSQDQTSLKRKFIIDLSQQLDEGFDESILYFDREEEKPLDLSKKVELLIEEIFVLIVGFTFSSAIMAVSLYILKIVFNWTDLNIHQLLLNNLYIPLIGGLSLVIKDGMSRKEIIKESRVESAEQFEKVFNKIVDKLVVEQKFKKVIIFVDDLDRCNHEEVEQVLSALFTFFNNKRCTYLIAADHKVIRRYIGDFLNLQPILKDTGEPDIEEMKLYKESEANEYLKKIFQINFLLPRIPEGIIKDYIQKLIRGNNIIPDIGSNPFAEDYLVNMIINSFEHNPRQIKHFIRTLAFQLGIITEKINITKNEEEKTNLEKIINSPELLAKILIIQDRFPDFYEEISIKPKLIKEHESGKDGDARLQGLLSQEPRFYNSINRSEERKVIDPYYFIYYSGLTGLSESQAVDPGQIKALAKNANFEDLEKIFNGLTDEPRSELVENLKSELKDPELPAQSPEKTNVIRSLFHLIPLIDEEILRERKLNELVSSTTEYMEEFKNLQAMDFEPIYKVIDPETLKKLLAAEGLAEIGPKTQMVNGFLNSINEVKAETKELLINAILDDLLSPLELFNLAIGALTQITEYLKENAQAKSKIIQALKDRVTNEKQPLIDLVSTMREQFNQEEERAIRELTSSFISENNPELNLFILGRPDFIHSFVNKTDLSELLTERIRVAEPNEIDQIFDQIFQEAYINILGTEALDNILIKYIVSALGADMPRISHLRVSIPNLINRSTKKKLIVDNILKGIDDKLDNEVDQILSNLWDSREQWLIDEKTKNTFKRKLSTIKKRTLRESTKNNIDGYLSQLN